MKIVGTRIREEPATFRTAMATAGIALGSSREGRWIVERACAVSSDALLKILDDAVPESVSEAVDLMVARRLAGEPLQYVLGAWDFRGIELLVDRRVLIPRPETEQVVDVVLTELAKSAGPSAPVVLVDLGTGSGAIALSVALEGASDASRVRGDVRDRLEVWATDLSADALDVARSNLALLASSNAAAARRVRVGQGTWYDSLPRKLVGRVNLVVSNPPYVSEAEWQVLDPQVRDYEPRMALVPGSTGIEAIEQVVSRAPEWLAPGGTLVCELAPAQAAIAAGLAEGAGMVDVTVRHDLAGKLRVLVARKRL